MKHNLEPIKKEFYDFIDMCEIIDNILGYDQRDVGEHLYPEMNDPPYLDFWHWQADNCLPDNFANDSYSYVCVHPMCAENEKKWIKDIQQVWYDTFKDIADEDGYIDIWVCW